MDFDGLVQTCLAGIVRIVDERLAHVVVGGIGEHGLDEVLGDVVRLTGDGVVENVASFVVATEQSSARVDQ